MCVFIRQRLLLYSAVWFAFLKSACILFWHGESVLTETNSADYLIIASCNGGNLAIVGVTALEH